MPVPSNISFLTATDLGALPATATQTVDDAGTTYTVYYSFTAPTGVVEIGAWGFGDLVTYRPTLHAYVGPASAPTPVVDAAGGITALNVPCQFPVTAGEDYFLEIVPNAGNPSPAVLTLSVQTAPAGGVAIGSFAVNDDQTGGFPLTLLSGTTNYTVLKFIADFPWGDAGDTLTNGTVLVENGDTHAVQLYNSSYQLLATHVLVAGHLPIRTCNALSKFYVGTQDNPTKVYTVTSDGTISTAEVLTAMTSCSALAANNAGTILYHTFTGTGVAVRTWNLATHAAGANLAVGIANYVVSDILVLSDDTILVGYKKTTATRDFKVLHYSGAGATLNTYTFPEPGAGEATRLAYAIDDPTSFWVMSHPASVTGQIDFLNVKVSDGSILHTITHEEFEAGVYRGTATATPVARFGASGSCPFWITRSAIPTTTTFTIRRQRRFLLPSSQTNYRMSIPTLELLMRTGIGLLPDAAGGSTPLGVDPEVRMRISKDGGKTWLPERVASAGLRGEFKDRVRWLQATGNYRNAVCEITVDEPVDWQMLAMLGEPIEGSS